jgi:tetratricopeptide (TPR) repeat protein
MNSELQEEQILHVESEAPEAQEARRKKHKRFLIFVIWPMFLVAFLSFAFPKDYLQETMHNIKFTEQTKGKEDPSLVYLYNHVGYLYLQKDKPVPAVPYLMHALELAEKVYGPTGVWTIRELNNLGVAYRDMNQPDTAEKYFREADKRQPSKGH